MATNSRFQRVRAVSLPVLKMKPNAARFIFIQSPMFTGKKIDDKKEAATLVRGVDMESGEEGLLIMTAVMKSELRDAYPENGYVGKGFEVCITRQADRNAGQNYNLVSISEVSLPEDFERPRTYTQAEVNDPAAAAANAAAQTAKASAKK